MRSVLSLPAVLPFIIMGFGSTDALAQSAGPDEAVQPNGAVMQHVALTAGQKSAIYNAVIRQATRPRAEQMCAAVGAPVPPFAELSDLPDAASVGMPGVLKYAMVATDVVVVDPVAMRVVDVIRNGAKP